MPAHLTAADVDEAIRLANDHFVDTAKQSKDIASYLNMTLAERHHRKWKGVGCSMELVGAVVCLTGLMLAITEEMWLVEGLIATFVGFFFGMFGWLVTDGDAYPS